MKKLLLIVNSVAGKKTALTALFDIVDTFFKHDFEVTVATTQRRNHAKEMAQSAYKNGYDIVVCCGGDGTMNEVVSGILTENDNAPIPIGYIPCGSTNDFADTLGLSSDIHKAALNITKCNERKLDIGKFNSDKYFSYIASFGAFTSASYSAPQDLKNTLGHFAYVLQGIKDLSSIKPTHCIVKAKGKTFEDDFIFASVSNTKSVAGIVKLKDNIVDLQDGLFEVILVRNPKDIIELNEILIGATNSDFSSKMFEFFKTDIIDFSFTKSVPWSLDGEKAKGEKEIEIKNLHGVISIYK